MSLYYYRPLKKGTSISDLRARSVERRLAGIDTSTRHCTVRLSGNNYVVVWSYGTEETTLLSTAIRFLREGRSITLTLLPLSKSSTETRQFSIRRILSWFPSQPTMQYITASVNLALRHQSNVVRMTNAHGFK